LVIATGAVMLLLAIDVLPESLGDLLERAIPIILVIVGLNMLLIDRVRFGNWIALALSMVILGVIVYFAYQTQSDIVRDEYVESIEPIFLGDHIQGVNVNIEILDATVTITDSGTRALDATFTGSTESEVTIAVQENEDGIVDFTITEKRTSGIPNLGAMGSGELQVLLPVGVTINSLNFNNKDGTATFNFQSLDVPRFNIQNQHGNVALFLPHSGITISDVNIASGDLRLVVDPAITLQVRNAPPQPRTLVDENVYLFLANGGIESKGGVTDYDFIVNLAMPGGRLTIQRPEGT
ncbi:MAG TPA: hypothetical protein VJZ27_11340, partial [Aggregatilineales bacterium]|nr:hypothetical protein [Aggregatilineales bacterium]